MAPVVGTVEARDITGAGVDAAAGVEQQAAAAGTTATWAETAGSWFGGWGGDGGGYAEGGAGSGCGGGGCAEGGCVQGGCVEGGFATDRGCVDSGMGSMCFEPDPTTASASAHWQYVGEGRGSFHPVTKVPLMNEFGLPFN